MRKRLVTGKGLNRIFKSVPIRRCFKKVKQRASLLKCRFIKVDRLLCFSVSSLLLIFPSCSSVSGNTTTFPNFSHWDDIPSISSFPADRAPAVIHRASRGMDADKKYRRRAAQARRRPDILWGAYHFCNGGDMQRQLNFSMDQIGYDPAGPYRTLMVFDFEHNVVGRRNHMSIANLAALIRQFHARTGVYPVIYVNPNWFNKRVSSDRHSAADQRVIRRCPLWTSAYKAKPNPTAIFRSWTVWQYSGDSTNAAYGDYAGAFEKAKHPRGVKGVGKKLEMNLFRGSKSSLRNFWARHSIPTRF